MSRPCSVCRDPRRGSIDTAVLAGESFRSIGKRFEMSSAAVFRHKRHMADHQAPKGTRVPFVGGDEWHLDVSRQMGAAQEATLRVLREATAGGDLRVQLQACGTLQKQCEFFYAMSQDRHIEAIEQRLAKMEQALLAPSSAQNGHQEVAWSGH